MKRLLLPLFAVTMLSFASWHILTASQEVRLTEPLATPPVTPRSRTVAGAGMVEPKRENIAVGSPLPGVVDTVLVKQGDRVAAGTPLFKLDARHTEAELKVRKAQLASMQAQLYKLKAMPRPEEIPSSEAFVAEMQALLTERQDSMRRKEDLFKRKVVPEEEVVSSRQACAAAKAQLAKAEAQHRLLLAGAWSTDIELAKAAIEHAQTQVSQTEVELSRLTTLAPRLTDDDGTEFEYEVLQINIRSGEFLSTPAHQAAIVLGVLGERHLRVDIDEHDIARFQKGRPATASFRGVAGRKYPLRFVRVEPFVIPKKSLTGDNTERVDTRVLQVLYALEPDADVYVGQQMDVFIHDE